jgi:hypothetical protein
VVQVVEYNSLESLRPSVQAPVTPKKKKENSNSIVLSGFLEDPKLYLNQKLCHNQGQTQQGDWTLIT